MREKQLMIGVPTKDHPRYIQFYLSKTLDKAKESCIDLHIYDSSETTLTEDIVNKKIERGYSNLYYHRYDADLALENKVKNILVDSGYEYVWLCGDGVILDLENILPFVIDEMGKNRDLIVFNCTDGKGRYTEYDDPIKLILEQWVSISLYGGTIYRGDFFSGQEWDKFLPLYKDNIPLAGAFDILAKKAFDVVSVDTWFCVHSVYKEESTWITGGRLLQAVVDHIPEATYNLPQVYNPVKKNVAKLFSTGRDMLLAPNIWWLRTTNNVTPQKVVKYRKQLQEITDTNYFLFLGASFVPKEIAKKLANIFSYA